jgi:hypothetical protein
MAQQVTAYRLQAFGYELTVRPSQGGWLGFIREMPGGQISPATDRPNELNATKLATCRLAQSLGGATGQSVMDPCEDLLEQWEKITLPAD